MSEPMPILFVNMHRAWGGQAAMVLVLARGLAARGHRCFVGAPELSVLKVRAEEAGLETVGGLEFRRGFHPVSFLRDARRMCDFIRDRGVRLVESNGSQDTWAAVFAVRGFGGRVKLVRWRHNTFRVPPHFFNKLLYRRWIHHVVVSAPEVKPILVDSGLVPEEKVSVLGCAADSSRFAGAFDRLGVRRELGLTVSDLAVVCAARLAPEKGHDVLLRAAAEVVREVPSARFLLVGDGHQRSSLTALAAELKIAERVSFLGFREDVPRIMSACDLNVLTPVGGESFGIALLEGFLAGLAAVATDVGGVRGVCRDGVTGLLCPPGDAHRVAEAVVRLLRDKGLRDRLAASGKRMAEEEFSEDALIGRAEDLFLRVLSGGSPA